MALVALEIPKVGLVMENARLVRWLKNVGDVVKQGEPLLELETEKSVIEIESTESGRLVEILMQADQEAHVGDRVAWLEKDVAAAGPASGASTSRAAVSHGRPTGRIKSSPVARRLAAQNGVDLRQVTGTGPRGRVQLSDVRRVMETRPVRGAPPATPSGPQPLSSMRRALARTMTLSNVTVPQFMVARAVDWTAIHAVRAKLVAQMPAGAPKLSVNDFLLQGIARTLLSFPALNATFSGDPDSPDAALVPSSGAHIGLVVALEQGLLVPVFHHVERLGLADLARRRNETVERALQGKLKRDELEGATFSLSNLGALGPDRFTALINPPQSAILAVGRQRDCVVAINGGVHIRPMSELTLTVDHRVADGRLASDFLTALLEVLESEAWRLN